MQAKNTNGPLARAECTKKLLSRQDHVSNCERESQRINPASIACERCILGAIIENDDLVMPDVIASGLCVADFFLSDHRRIFDAMLQLWQEAKHVDQILLVE